jgi:formamidase
MKSMEIDRSERLTDEPSTGHNRFHPDIPPVLAVEVEEEVVLETRDTADGQLGLSATEADLGGMEVGAVHPFTGPISVKGAQPSDLLEVELLDLIPQPYAFSTIIPGLGFLRDICTIPFLVHWHISDGCATSPQLPGVRIPGAPFMGVSGVDPSHAQLRAWTQRGQDLLDCGGLVFPPDTAGAGPSHGPAATAGLRTLPPRENGGNWDAHHALAGCHHSAEPLPEPGE